MGWKRLVDAETEVFGPGLLLRFRSTDAPHGGDIIAIAVYFPTAPALSLFQAAGHEAGYPMGYRQPTLPAESTNDRNPATVRKSWLLDNFQHVIFGVDRNSVEYTEDYVIVARAMD